MPSPAELDDLPERPRLTGWRAHAVAVAAPLVYLGLRRLTYDWFGSEAVVGTTLLLVVVLGRYLSTPAAWTALAFSVVPVAVLRHVDPRYADDMQSPLRMALQMFLYFAVGGLIVRQQTRWRSAIDDLRRRELAAKEANARWELASDYAQLGTFDWDFVRNTTKWSPMMEQLHGLAPGEHDGKTGSGFKRMHPDDVPLVQAAIEQAKSSGRTMSITYRVRLPDGRERWIEGIGRVALENGEPVRLAGVCSDVTQRHEAYIAAMRYEALAEDAPLGVYRCSATGQLEYANSAFVRITGYRMEEIDSKNWVRMIHPDDVEALAANWADCLKHPRRFSSEFRYVRPDGAVVWTISHNAPLFDDQGRFEGYVGYVNDVTERKRADEALQTSEARFRAIVEHAEPAVFLKDEQGRYQVVNTTFERLMNKPAAELIGRDDRELFPRETAEMFLATDRRVRETGKAEHAEEEIDLADGKRTYLSVKYPIADARGRVVGVGGYATDITPLKQIQTELLRDRRLLRDLIDVQEQERQFICNELHDGTIQFLVGALMTLQSPKVRRDKDDEALEKAEKLLTQAMAEARRLIGGVRSSLLDDLGVVAAVEDLLGQNREQGLDVDFAHDDDFHDLDDKTAVTLFRVVQEALSNVRKHGGVERAVVELRRRGDDVALTVRDEGRGFAAERVRPECFGLRGMRERVLLAGGTFQLSSKPGGGTTVEAVLPISPPKASTEGL